MKFLLIGLFLFLSSAPQQSEWQFVHAERGVKVYWKREAGTDFIIMKVHNGAHDLISYSYDYELKEGQQTVHQGNHYYNRLKKDKSSEIRISRALPYVNLVRIKNFRISSDRGH